MGEERKKIIALAGGIVAAIVIIVIIVAIVSGSENENLESSTNDTTDEETTQIETETYYVEKETTLELSTTIESPTTTELLVTMEEPTRIIQQTNKKPEVQVTTNEQVITQSVEENESTTESGEERERRESPYYSKRDIVKVAYTEDGYIDVRNTILGNDFDENDENQEFNALKVKEIVDFIEQNSNVHCYVYGMYDLKAASYVKFYPYYDIRDYQLWTASYNPDGSCKEVIFFYFDNNFNLVKGTHPWEKYKWWGTAYIVPNLDPSEIKDNDPKETDNPNYYKKDIIKFLYNEDGTSNIKDTIIGISADISDTFKFIQSINEVKQLTNMYMEMHGSCTTGCSLKNTDIMSAHYDIRDWEFRIGITEDDMKSYYWDEDYNFIQEQ